MTLPESIDGPQYVKRLNQEQRTRLAREIRDQSHVHKLLTGRQSGFAKLRQRGGVSGYPSRGELELDLVENSHASASLSYAGGLVRQHPPCPPQPLLPPPPPSPRSALRR